MRKAQDAADLQAAIESFTIDRHGVVTKIREIDLANTSATSMSKVKANVSAHPPVITQFDARYDL